MKNDVRTSTIRRILTALIGLPVYVFALAAGYLNSFLILIASMAITLVSLYEYYKICDRGNEGRPFIAVGLTAGAVVNIAIYLFAFGNNFGLTEQSGISGAGIIFAILILFVSVILVLQLFKRPLKGGIHSLSSTVFGVVYIVLFFSHVILIKSLTDGFLYLLILNIVVMLNDSAALFGGILIGKHKTNFAASPNKTWEGYFSGVVVSIIAMIATNQAYFVLLNKQLFSLPEAAVLGLFLSVLGHTGDLAESVIKRDAAKKDSGSIMPGHGGVWDVFDAMIFTSPFFYYYLILKGIN